MGHPVLCTHLPENGCRCGAKINLIPSFKRSCVQKLFGDSSVFRREEDLVDHRGDGDCGLLIGEERCRLLVVQGERDKFTEEVLL